MQLVELIATLAVAQYLAFGALTGRARAKSGLKAPVMTGDDGFERMYRVQMNTLEVMMAFLPSLFIAALHWPAVLVAGLGVIYLVGRVIYWRAYVAQPSKRGLGFMLSMMPTLALALLALIGNVLALCGAIA
ncbi:MAPEG family protein [Pseudorhodobacter sp.]|uniref:MAPEG family protein n=1 Tax=Pseudorhodobacter sp. TaxID=1934400 RepID=UPI00264A0AD0|nr:MAPEG family protein [Pseudorhodobacter sp.]MDN5786001.1 MAPEG family protein [Pseudorhodobacter sp.]